MRLSADAKAYAAAHPADVHDLFYSIDGGEAEPPVQRDRLAKVLAEAFQHGFDHAKASQRRLEKLAKGKA